MGIIAGQSLTVDFRTFSSTGALTDADSTPTGTLVINGTNNAATVTVTNKTTGQYKAAVTVPTTVAIGDVVQLSIAATVSSVASGGIIYTGTVDLPPTNQTWYVRTTGSNSNHGRSPDAAKLTIAAAVTAASAGDIIHIGAGTFTETVSATKQLTYIGVGRGQTIWTNSGATLTLSAACAGSKFYDLSIISSGTTAAGVTATDYVNNLYFQNCYVEGYIDAITHHSSKGFRAKNCEFVGDWDGLGQNDSVQFLVEDSIIKTTGEYTWNGSVYTGDLSMQGAQCSGGSGIFRNCKLIGERQHPTNQITAAITTTNGNVLLENCYLQSIVYSETTTGTIIGLNHDTGGIVEMRNVRFQTAQDTLDPETATIRDIVHSSGAVVVDRGSNVTVAKISGNGSYIRAVDTGLGYTSTLATNLGTTNTTIAAATTLTASGVRSALGMAAADLDEQLDAIDAGAGDATAANQALILAQVNKITTGRLNVISHVHANDVVINQGETYSSSLNPLTFTFASGDSWPTDLTAYTITLIATQTHDTTGATPTTPASISQAGSVVTATGDSRAVRVDFTAAQTAALTPGLYEYYLKASTGSGGSTVDWLRQGQLRVIDATP